MGKASCSGQTGIKLTWNATMVNLRIYHRIKAPSFKVSPGTGVVVFFFFLNPIYSLLWRTICKRLNIHDVCIANLPSPLGFSSSSALSDHRVVLEAPVAL